MPVDTAIDVLWPSRLPRDPGGALQNHLFRLRRGLPADLIESVGEGYRLDPSAIDVDCDRLPAMLSDGEATDAATFAEIDAVLERWQGPALPELDEVDDARTESMRLAELRMRAQEVRAEHWLAQGTTDGLVAELSALADAEPSRERPRALMMAALAAQHAALLGGLPDVVGVWAPASCLPVPANTLIGRHRLAAEVAALAESRRLVSLVGPGGVGKTRLLVEAGHLLRAARPERLVVLCELATADEGSTVNVAAASLGIDVRPGVTLADQVAGVLGDGELVVLADNCEHVLELVD